MVPGLQKINYMEVTDGYQYSSLLRSGINKVGKTFCNTRPEEEILYQN
jgi:hypothetical protein